jgi:hypothetical protein
MGSAEQVRDDAEVRPGVRKCDDQQLSTVTRIVLADTTKRRQRCSKQCQRFYGDESCVKDLGIQAARRDDGL